METTHVHNMVNKHNGYHVLLSKKKKKKKKKLLKGNKQCYHPRKKTHKHVSLLVKFWHLNSNANIEVKQCIYIELLRFQR